MHLICPPKFWISTDFNFSWDGFNTQEKWKTKVVLNVFYFFLLWGSGGGGCGRSKQGALWGMGKWRIGQRPSNLVRNLPLATLHPTLMLHFSWFAYAAVMRIYKHYFFNLKDPSTGLFKNQFSFFAEPTLFFPWACLLFFSPSPTSMKCYNCY